VARLNSGVRAHNGRSMRFALFILALLLFPPICKAGGTVEFDQIDRLLQQKPEIRAALVGSLVMPNSAYAQVRLGSHFDHLGAYRLGPYEFQAFPKGQTGVPVLVTLCTSYLFLDRSGKVLPMGSDREFSATQVRELLNAVVLRDAGASSEASCP